MIINVSCLNQCLIVNKLTMIIEITETQKTNKRNEQTNNLENYKALKFWSSFIVLFSF